MKNILFIFTIAFLSTNRFAHAGDWQWASSAEGGYDEHGKCVATDGAGNVYAAGNFFSDTLVYGDSVFTNKGIATSDIYLAKYDASGNLLWVRHAGGNNDDDVNSIAVDQNGNVYLTGFFYGVSVSFGSEVLVNAGNANYDDIFVAKYDSSGNIVWARRAGGTDYDSGNSVAVDNTGNVFVTGAFRSYQLDFGVAVLTNADGTGNSADLYIVKYDSTGNVVWAKSAGVTYYYEEGKAITTDALGNIYTSGFFGSPELVLGGTTLTNVHTGHYDIYVVKYDGAGNMAWAKRTGGDESEESYSMKTDAGGNLYITGYNTSPEIIFGNDTVTNLTPPFSDLFIFKYSTDGDELWARGAGGDRFDPGNAIAIDQEGSVYVTGSFSSAILDFGTFTLLNSNSTGGYFDTYVAKYTEDGNPLWARNVAGSYGTSIAIDGSGGIYLTGYFGGLTVAFGNIILTKSGGWDLYVARLSTTIGISEENTGTAFTIVPNPFTDAIIFHFDKTRYNATLKIADLTGRIVFTSAVANGSNTFILSRNDFVKSGMYFLQLSDERGKTETGKVIVQ